MVQLCGRDENSSRISVGTVQGENRGHRNGAGDVDCTNDGDLALTMTLVWLVSQYHGAITLTGKILPKTRKGPIDNMVPVLERDQISPPLSQKRNDGELKALLSDPRAQREAALRGYLPIPLSLDTALKHEVAYPCSPRNYLTSNTSKE